MFDGFIFPVLIFGGMGLAAGILLSAASRVFAVKSDPLKDRIYEALPHINCGACGYSGCEAYAEAVADKGEKTGLCRPGGKAAADSISRIMGVTSENTEKTIAVVRCLGNEECARIDFEYNGDPSCKAAKRLYGGMKGCKYACIGFGDCAAECPTGAIDVKNRLARVDEEKCIGCGLCVKICPNSVIDMRRSDIPAAQVLCSSHDFGKNVKAVCSTGCIGCGICEKCCNYDAAHVKNHLSVIDGSKCTACGECVKKCPVSVIKLI